MNLLETLRTADSLSLDDNFVRYFTLEDLKEPDDYALLVSIDGIDNNFTNEDCNNAVFNPFNNSWDIKAGDEEAVTIKVYKVTQITR